MPDVEAGSVAVELSGTLRADATPRDFGASLEIDARTIRPAGIAGRGAPIPVEGGVNVSVAGELVAEHIREWRAGRDVSLPVVLRRPTRYLNPGVPDSERSLALQGTSLVASAKSALLVDVTARGGWASEAAATARAAARRAITTAVAPWSPQSAGIVTAIVIGDRSGLDVDVQRRLQEAGTYHVIAISGGNIAILTGAMLGIFRIAGLLNRFAMLGAIACLVAYGAIVGDGGGRSVERATLMAIVYLAARALDLRGAPENILCLVVALLLTVDPLAVGDPGFLLTCGATAGILFVVPVVQQWPIPRLLKPAAILLASSVAAEVMLMPVGTAFFSRVTFAGVILNFAAVPLMAVAQIAGMAIVPLAAVSSTLTNAAGLIAHLGADGLVRSADLVEVAPWLTWRVVPPSAPGLAIYYGCLCASWWLWRRRARSIPGAESGRARRVRLASAVCGGCAALWILGEPWVLLTSGGGLLRVTFLDVGQGDATLIRFPGGDSLLVDAGGLGTGSAFDIGDRVVAPVLRHYGIGRLGTTVMSHAHPDHAGGLPAILREFRPRDVWDGVPVPRLEARRELFMDAEEIGARWTTIQRGDRLSIDGVEVVVKHPPPPDWERQEVRNDDSVVLEIRWKDVSIVLPGDIGREVEEQIAASFEPALVRILKVPHHGSLTSSSTGFLRALAPRIAIVSAGRGNSYGHPAPPVLRRYEEIGARIYRTDGDGAIEVETNGTELSVRTFVER